MTLFKPRQRRFAELVSQLVHGNPFLPKRLELEKQALGPDYQPDQQTAWSLIPNATTRRANIDALVDRARHLANELRDHLRQGATASETELQLYDDLVMHVLYYQSYDDWYEFVAPEQVRPRRVKSADWKRFLAKYRDYIEIGDLPLPSRGEPELIYALLNQVCRAFFNIYQCVIGQSLPSARLRSMIWESIFTFDLRRYRNCLIGNMADISTLIVGPSGTGKDLVASAIGRSSFIPFDGESARFEADAEKAFMPLNLSAMSAGLIESELFGHVAGAFTGATAARKGWLEKCEPSGTVFLDEIGDLDVAIQVKLLRLLQNRQFQRVGESKTHDFRGKIVSATNRDLESAIAAGTFREDLFYRLCSDVIRTPTLYEQLADSPEDMSRLIGFITSRMIPDPDEQASMVQYISNWIDERLSPEYDWPGNVRELEQCVRNILVHNDYQPRTDRESATTAKARISRDFATAAISMDEMQSRYCTVAYWKSGTFEKAAARLGIDRRTVRARLDESLLQELREAD